MSADNDHPSQGYMTIKQKIMESSRDPPFVDGRKRSSSRFSYLSSSTASNRNSSSSEASSLCDGPPRVDQPFRDGRRRKICHACYRPFGDAEHVEICTGCCFERPAGCRACNWTGWARCSACEGGEVQESQRPRGRAVVGARPFAAGFMRAPLAGRTSEDQGRPSRSWGLR